MGARAPRARVRRRAPGRHWGVRLSSTVGDLRDAVRVAQRAVPNVPARPEFAGLLVVAGAASASVIGSRNEETTVAATATATALEPGRVLLPASALAAYLATFDAPTAVELVHDGGPTATVRAGQGAPYHLRVIDATLRLPDPPAAEPLTVDFTRLGAALASVRATLDPDTGAVQVVSGPDGLALHSTDMHRLSRCVVPEAGFGDHRIVLPYEALDWVAKLAVTTVTLDPASPAVRFAGPGAVVSTRLLATPFPDVAPLLRQTPPHRTRLSASALSTALARLRALSPQASVTVEIAEEAVVVRMNSEDVGWGEERLDARGTVGPPTLFYVRAGYLADAITALAPADDVVEVRWSDSLAAVHLVASGPLATTVLVMPQRPPAT